MNNEDFYKRIRYKHNESMISKMWDLRSKNQFCDIAIKVGERVFHCHRIILSAASEYFRAMFGGGFSESTATEVTLHEIDVNTFESILLFMYTGDVDINTSNVFDLIYAAEFYGLHALLEKPLVEFASNNLRTLSREDILSTFASAEATKTTRLGTLLRRHIYHHLGPFSESPEFVNLSWDNITEFFALASSPGGPILTDTFVKGILKWIRGQVNASVDERNSYLDQLSKIIHDTKSFTNYVQEMIERHVNEEQAPDTNVVADVFDERPPKFLRAFVVTSRFNPQWYEINYGSITRRYIGTFLSLFTFHEMNTHSAWAYSGECVWFSHFMKNIVIDDSLYSLTREPFETPEDFKRPTFLRASHVSLYPYQSLSPPPRYVYNFDMCGMDNNIFLSDKFETPFIGDVNPYYDAVQSSSWTWEELSRGVFLYKRDVDKWLPLPRPRKTHLKSCATCDERLVYLIGGRGSDGCVQAYDLRTAAWMELPPATGTYEGAACCIRDGKIWVVGGEKNSHAVEIFDPISSTWECREDLRWRRTKDHQLVNWDSVRHGRTVVSFCNTTFTSRKVLFADDSHLDSWNVMPDLDAALKKSRVKPDGYQFSGIADMVAF